MKNLLILLTLITLFACNSDDDNDETKLIGVYVDVGIDLTVINSDGEDLLNPNNPNHLDLDKIRVFYEIDGELQNMYDPNMNAPRMFWVVKHDHENFYRMKLTLNAKETESKPKTILQWDDGSRDTFETTFERTSNTLIKKKLWLNGEFLTEFDINRDTEPTFNFSK